MNEEQSKRLSDAAESLLQASDALDDARDAVNDRRFESETERDRSTAASQMANRLDSAGKRMEDAIRKATVAAAALARPGAFARYREGITATREGRSLGRGAVEQDGSANKRAAGQEALTRLEAALAIAAVLVFPE
jgi:hypothetical protein